MLISRKRDGKGMNQSTRILYALGFLASVFGIGYGLGQTGDQFRLGLLLGGISIGVVTFISWVISANDEDRLKKMGLADLEDLRPDLQITSKLSKSENKSMAQNALFTGNEAGLLPEQIRPERVREFPIDCDYCNLLISPAMQQITVGSKKYHEDCWGKQIEKNRKNLSLGKGKLDSV